MTAQLLPLFWHNLLLPPDSKNVTAGANPMDLKRGIDKAVIEVVKALKEQSQKVGDSNDKIKQVASISANNDQTIGGLIAEAMSKVKQEGVITIEEAKGIELMLMWLKVCSLTAAISLLICYRQRENGSRLRKSFHPDLR